MNDNDLITIIVPVYNVEKYLKRCVDSIIKQTYKRLEIILVDDGSTDNSSKICDDYKKSDSRVIVIHKKNGGLSSARNAGLDIASGKYVAFCDSDDLLNYNMIKILHDLIISTNTDISICNYEKFNDEEKINFRKSCNLDQYKVFDKIEAHSLSLCYDYMLIAWNKLYKKSLFNKVRYPEGQIYEDGFVIHHILDNVKKVSYVNIVLYHYYQRDDSITHLKFNKKNMDVIKTMDNKIEFYKKNVEYKSVLNLAYQRYLQSIIIMYNKAYRSDKKSKYIVTLKYKYDELYKLCIKNMSFKYKIKYMIFRIFPKVYIQFYELINIVLKKTRRS